ncbi:hypothetical protein D3C76_1519570 [compost metagenome]
MADVGDHVPRRTVRFEGKGIDMAAGIIGDQQVPLRPRLQSQMTRISPQRCLIPAQHRQRPVLRIDRETGNPSFGLFAYCIQSQPLGIDGYERRIHEIREAVEDPHFPGVPPQFAEINPRLPAFGVGTRVK